MGAGTTFPGDDWRSHSPDFTGERFRRNLQVVDRLKGWAQAGAGRIYLQVLDLDDLDHIRLLGAEVLPHV